jgi:TrmH family RNA methyltransferase
VTEPLGRQHPTIRRLRALRRDPLLRRDESVFIAEGVHLAQAALACSADLELVVVSPRLDASTEGRALLAEIRDRGIDLAETTDAVLDSVQDARSAQPVLCLVRRHPWAEDAGLGTEDGAPFVVVAAGIQDPGNLGAIIRTADAAGATACFVFEGSCDPFHPRAVRATMGAIFRVPVIQDSPETLFARLREHGLRLIGTEAGRGSDYDRCDLTGPLAILLGSEGAGLTDPLRVALDESVRVPMREGVESLSVGAAAAVVLFEAARQRRA